MKYFHTLLRIQGVDVSERWLSVEEIAEHWYLKRYGVHMDSKISDAGS